MSILRSLERRSLERRGAPPGSSWGDSTPASNSMLGGTVAGTQVSENTALQIGAVYGSVSVIAESVSSLPIDLMTTPRRRTGTLLPPSQLITNPYAEISVTDWWTQFCLSLALRGNFFGQIIARDKSLYPTQIKPIHPDRARVRRLTDGSIEYRFNGYVVPNDNVFHVRFLSVADTLVGLNPVEYLRNVFGLARAADLYGGTFFQNSAMPSGVISHPEDFDDEEALAWAQSWKQMHQGISQANLPAILTGGAKFQPISITPEDAQFLQSRQYDASVICGQIFRVPPHMIGIVDRTTSWGTGIEQQELGFVRNTLVGYLTRAERALTKIHPPGQFVKFDLSDRLRGDRTSRYQAHALGIAGGFLVPDEARAIEDMPPLPGGIGQTALAPINSTTLKQMVQQQQAAQKQQQSVVAGQSGDQPQQP